MVEKQWFITLALVSGLLLTLVACSTDDANPPEAPPAATSETSAVENETEEEPLVVDVKGLPEAKYDAVIDGLLSSEIPEPDAAWRVHQLEQDLALFDDSRTKTVAFIAGKNFLNEPTVVVEVSRDGEWVLVLTPARSMLPSVAEDAGVKAPAQTSAWVRSVDLGDGEPSRDHVVVDLSDQELRIYRDGQLNESFEAGIGASDTPTPAGVTGYLQARYLDPAQGQKEHRIQLSSLHSDAADEPFGGDDGGLIGIHYQDDRRGAISHGCVRLGADAIEAVDSLPLGTPISIQGR